MSGPAGVPPQGRVSVALRWVRRAALAIVVFSVLILGTTAGHVWWDGRQDVHPVSDVILVLGAAQYNGEPSGIFAARLDHAAQLFHAHVAAHILTVGGGQPADRTTEGASGAAYLERNGVPAAALVPVPSGSNTFRSLVAAREVMKANGWTSVVIVTDPWHALRSRTMAADLGLTVHVSPVESGPVVHSRSTELRYIGRETVAFLCYSLFGDSCETGPVAA